MMYISIIFGGGGMDYYQILGANIRALRIGKELTQEKLAELSNLHRTYIGAIERGDRNISLKNIISIANALNVDPAELLIIKEEIKE